MKVLWFSPTPVNYSQETWAHNGGGWISSLQNIVKSIENIDLGIVFESTQKLEKKFDTKLFSQTKKLKLKMDVK